MTIIPMAVILVILCKVLNIAQREVDITLWMKLLIVVILVPIYEEIIFRSLLKFKPINIFLFISTTIGLIIFSILKSNFEAIAIFSTILFSFLVILFSFKKTHIESFISSKFKYFFYATILTFGLIHAFNFTGNIYAILALSFILGSPQLVLGAILGYIRMNYGLVYSILFHMIVNSSILFSILYKL